MLGPLLLLALATGPELVPRLAFEVVNARQAGQSILQLSDVVGPEARSVGARAPAKAVLLVTSAVTECEPCGRDLEALGAIAEREKGRGGLVLAVILTARPRDAELVRRRLSDTNLRYPILLDAYGLVRARLGLVSPRRAVLIRSDGRIVRHFDLGKDGVEAAERGLADELEEESL